MRFAKSVSGSQERTLPGGIHGPQHEREPQPLEFRLRPFRCFGQQACGVLELLPHPRRHHRQLLLERLAERVQASPRRRWTSSSRRCMASRRDGAPAPPSTASTRFCKRRRASRSAVSARARSFGRWSMTRLNSAARATVTYAPSRDAAARPGARRAAQGRRPSHESSAGCCRRPSRSSTTGGTRPAGRSRASGDDGHGAIAKPATKEPGEEVPRVEGGVLAPHQRRAGL